MYLSMQSEKVHVHAECTGMPEFYTAVVHYDRRINEQDFFVGIAISINMYFYTHIYTLKHTHIYIYIYI